MNTRLSLFGLGLAALSLCISSWTPILMISTHEDNLEYDNNWPEIAVDASGNSYVTWEGYDGSDEEIYWIRIDSSGTPGTVQKISTHPDNIVNDDWLPQIAVDASGNSYVTWYGPGGNDREIYWIRIDSSGTPGTVQKISTHPDNIVNNDRFPQIAVDASGNSYVTWEGHDGNDREIYWVRIDSSGTPGTVQKISTHPDNIDHTDYDPRIAIGTSGDSYVVWHGCDREDCWEEPGDLEIYWVKIDASGKPGTVQKIPPTNPDNINVLASIPQIAVDASGNSYVVWSGMNEKNYDIYWLKINASGTLERIQKISIYLLSTICYDSNPQIGIDVSGDSYVTWESYNRGIANQFDKRICWVKIDASGKSERVHKISHGDSKHFDQNSRIAVDASGNSYIIWEGGDSSGNDHIFFTAHLPDSTLTVTVVISAIVVVVVIVLVIIARRKIGQRFLRNEKKKAQITENHNR